MQAVLTVLERRENRPGLRFKDLVAQAGRSRDSTRKALDSLIENGDVRRDIGFKVDVETDPLKRHRMLLNRSRYKVKKGRKLVSDSSHLLPKTPVYHLTDFHLAMIANISAVRQGEPVRKKYPTLQRPAKA